MSLKLYNTLTRKVETFRPQDEKRVKIYTCGPTVYARAHIGNLCSYIYWSLLVSVLRLNGYGVERVLNYTDVGHLTSDGDEGEDKLEAGARRERRTVWEVAEHYEELFMQDYLALELILPDKICKATDYIEADKQMIDVLMEKGYAYETTDGMYFDTAKFADYAKFARLDLDHLRAGARVDFSSEKRNVSDFALWKFIRLGEDHVMQWEYLGRMGYPGWHVECSAISHVELGEPLDIHTGGVDHIPVHHTNEIAQTEAAYGKKMCNFWLHCNFITIDGQKVSKSLGNVYSLDDLEEKGFLPLDFKMWVLQGHYQGERNFSFEDLAAAQARRLAWQNRIAACLQDEELVDMMPSSEFVEGLTAALNDNLNSAAAFFLIDNSELNLADWRLVDDVFALGLYDFGMPSEEQLELIRRREVARQNKDYALADKLRDELLAEGFAVLDTPEGAVWQIVVKNTA